MLKEKSNLFNVTPPVSPYPPGVAAWAALAEEARGGKYGCCKHYYDIATQYCPLRSISEEKINCDTASPKGDKNTNAPHVPRRRGQRVVLKIRTCRLN